MVDAVLMGGVYLPSDSFANVVQYLDHGTAVRSTPCSKAWWRTSKSRSSAAAARRYNIERGYIEKPLQVVVVVVIVWGQGWFIATGKMVLQS